jgi:hypothetical protein
MAALAMPLCASFFAMRSARCFVREKTRTVSTASVRRTWRRRSTFCSCGTR